MRDAACQRIRRSARSRHRWRGRGTRTRPPRASVASTRCAGSAPPPTYRSTSADYQQVSRCVMTSEYALQACSRHASRGIDQWSSEGAAASARSNALASGGLAPDPAPDGPVVTRPDSVSWAELSLTCRGGAPLREQSSLPMIILDTNVVSELMRPEPDVRVRTCGTMTPPGRTVPSASSPRLKPTPIRLNQSTSPSTGSAGNRSSADSPTSTTSPPDCPHRPRIVFPSLTRYCEGDGRGVRAGPPYTSRASRMCRRTRGLVLWDTSGIPCRTGRARLPA